ncbi:MAG: sugar phosphate isomerase/epimerase family protein [Candidatus Hodarchaeota archaeon]
MKIALNSYSTRNEWEKIKKVDGLIKICKDLNITSLEYLDRHFSVKEFGWDPKPKDQKSSEPELGDAIAKLKDAGIEVFSLGPHVRLLCGPDDIADVINEAKMWIDICASHGVPKMRGSMARSAGNLSALWPPPPKNMYDDDDEYKEDMEDYMEMVDMAFERITQVMTPVLQYAKQKGVTICQETHHSYSSNYIFMKKVLDKYPDNYGLAYDFGNYENDDLRYGMLENCGERVKYWHAKCYKFDKKGFETKLDYPRAVKINADQGFDGIFSIEFEGKYNGVLGAYQTTELLKYSIARYKGESYKMKTDFGSPNAIMKKFS